MTKDAIEAIRRVGGAARVAREAGLSDMTVHRAMANCRVHPKTANAIAEAVARLGEVVRVAEVTNTVDGEIRHIGIGWHTYRIRIRAHQGVRYRADVHYQLKHGETAWHAVGRVEAGTKAGLVIAAKASAKSRIEADRNKGRGGA